MLGSAAVTPEKSLEEEEGEEVEKVTSSDGARLAPDQVVTTAI